MDDKKVFSDEYQSDSETKAEVVPIPNGTVLQHQKEMDDKKVFSDEYQLDSETKADYEKAKPKRIVIRAKIIHD